MDKHNNIYLLEVYKISFYISYIPCSYIMKCGTYVENLEKSLKIKKQT